MGQELILFFLLNLNMQLRHSLYQIKKRVYSSLPPFSYNQNWYEAKYRQLLPPSVLTLQSSEFSSFFFLTLLLTVCGCAEIKNTPSPSLFHTDSELKMNEVSVALVSFLLFLSAVNIKVVDHNASSVGGLMIPKLFPQSIGSLMAAWRIC